MPTSFKSNVHCHTSSVMGIIINIYIVETENGVVVVDGAIALSSGKAVLKMIEQEIRKPLLAVLITYGHPDHYVGIGTIAGEKEIPIISTQEVLDQILERDRPDGLLSCAWSHLRNGNHGSISPSTSKRLRRSRPMERPLPRAGVLGERTSC